jgi:hypothetical protein
MKELEEADDINEARAKLQGVDAGKIRKEAPFHNASQGIA